MFSLVICSSLRIVADFCSDGFIARLSLNSVGFRVGKIDAGYGLRSVQVFLSDD
jgi:hypothetical protein